MNGNGFCCGCFHIKGAFTIIALTISLICIILMELFADFITRNKLIEG